MQALIPSVAVAVLLLAGTAAAQGVPKEPSPIRFDNMRLLVTRFDETFVFYRDVLGLAPTWASRATTTRRSRFLAERRSRCSDDR